MIKGNNNEDIVRELKKYKNYIHEEKYYIAERYATIFRWRLYNDSGMANIGHKCYIYQKEDEMIKSGYNNKTGILNICEDNFPVLAGIHINEVNIVSSEYVSLIKAICKKGNINGKIKCNIVAR